MKPVFVHISKNAGTSIVRTARGAITVAGHRTAASWVADHGRGAPLFAVLRNPFDRVVSEYFFRRRRFLAGEQNPHLANLNKSFDDWVLATFQDGEFRSAASLEASGTPYRRQNMVGDCLIWFLPQTQWIGGEDGEPLVEELLRYETLAEDWERFRRRHGIRRRLSHHNASTRGRDYRSYFSSRSRAIVEHYYAEDLEAFGYCFE